MRSLLLFSFVAVATACSQSAPVPGASDDAYTSHGEIQLHLTVDWEGTDLRPENLAAMKAFHAKYPDLAVLNFLNAAYYVKPGADKAEVTSSIASALGTHDELGLHIHGWKDLFEAAGVTFKDSPTFWGTPLDKTQCPVDCGHEIPISEYSTEELQRVVHFSIDTLSDNGFGRAKAFRTGGWMAKQNVRDAIAAEGIAVDESAVPVEFLRPLLGTMPLYDWLGALWAGTTPTAQPHTLAAASTVSSKSQTTARSPTT